VLKADVQGSLEAVTDFVERLERDDVKLSFVLRGIGGITENDVQLAAASSRHDHRVQRASRQALA